MVSCFYVELVGATFACSGFLPLVILGSTAVGLVDAELEPIIVWFSGHFPVEASFTFPHVLDKGSQLCELSVANFP